MASKTFSLSIIYWTPQAIYIAPPSTDLSPVAKKPLVKPSPARPARSELSPPLPESTRRSLRGYCWSLGDMQPSFPFSPPPVPIVLGPSQRPRPTFPVYPSITPRPPQMVIRSTVSPSAQMNGAASSSSASIFRAPAHKHAHHLHSIPPREKSTRTLIIDHMLWAHGRTRFAQARAELGMTDRTGDAYTPRQGRRERPESFDEDDEVPSDGEGVLPLYARAGGPGHPHDEEEDQRFARQDLPRARSLRHRSEALEKIVAGMLEQPPQDIPFPEDEPVVPVTPERPSDALSALPAPKHILPNGVRLRLALATVINDLFARQAPIPRRAVAAMGSSMSSTGSVSTPRSTDGVETPYAVAFPPSSTLPPALIPLATISNASPLVSAQSPYPPSPSHHRTPPIYQRPTPNARTLSMFVAGADPTTANSPPSLRCPRHLHTSCQICVEEKESVPTRPRGAGTVPSGRGRGPIPQGGGLTGFLTGSGVGSGLARGGPRGNVLRRAVPGLTDVPQEDGGRPPGAGAGRLSELIPRFIRLSALVASELGEETDTNEGGEPVRPAQAWYLLLAGLLTRAVLEGYLSSGWRGTSPVEVLLGVGLGCMNEREGGELDGDGGDREFREFEPDGMPHLRDAIGMLFPSLHARARDDGEATYEQEMRARLARFLDVPAGTPDLSTHMEDLAWQYPAEPVERAALRFCEAVAKWRGKPELETYKKRPPTAPDGPAPSPATETDPAVWLAVQRYFKIRTMAPPPAPPSVLASTSSAIPPPSIQVQQPLPLQEPVTNGRKRMWQAGMENAPPRHRQRLIDDASAGFGRFPVVLPPGGIRPGT
ncbi:hypothetical protein K488DRAFT_83692 [Vararia minispora EC-137]|uniref:Uncharacterized protein n=1 Tax=Vararia minispora EC-137 TaxID=1314806 RepID=A0ACB8QT68_9AGAM|nr:hypothetical protein K488DRAFT_83692 [Vararia minispora EC-137]